MYYLKIGTTAGTWTRITALTGVIVGFLYGSWTELLTALLILHGVDILTGLLIGAHERSINSKKMSAGVKKKVGGWLALVLANVIDRVLFDGQPLALTGLAFALIGNEGLSIVENLGILGLPLPNFITKYLEQIRDYQDNMEIELD